MGCTASTKVRHQGSTRSIGTDSNLLPDSHTTSSGQIKAANHSETMLASTAIAQASAKKEPQPMAKDESTAAPWTESERRCLTRAFSGAGSQDKLSSAARPNVNNSSSIGSHDEIETLAELRRLREHYLSMDVEAKDVIKHEIPKAVIEDLQRVWKDALSPALNAHCHRKLHLLQLDFQRYKLENDQKEFDENATGNAADFYSVLKMDVHLHFDSMWTSRQLLQFLQNKYGTEGHIDVGGVTIRQLLDEAAGVPFDGSGAKASVDRLKTEANHMMFMNFAHFNASFTPLGSEKLRQLAFAYDSPVEGRWPAELLKTVCSKAAPDNVVLEPRFTVFGRDLSEWRVLAAWAKRYQLPNESLRWAVQMPRIYQVWKSQGMVDCFGDMLSNFFQPLFEATLYPDKEENQDLAWLLGHLAMIDTVDDESKEDDFDVSDCPEPDKWTSPDNPSYTYYHYYFFVNIRALNTLRGRRGMNTFQLRPHCGEAGPANHLVSGFLFCDGISHGIKLAGQPVLQFLFYLCQVGVAMSPISNRVLFLKYMDSPFLNFFERGLKCTLTTDDPMQFHATETPLMEEYSVARNVWDLTATDLCEIARSSVYIALGDDAAREELDNDNPNVTNIPVRRLEFRAQQLKKFREGSS